MIRGRFETIERRYRNGGLGISVVCDWLFSWETGGATRHPNLRVTLGAEEDWTLATLLSVGIPAESPASFRTPVPNFVYWHE
jgi:hypothetical protein